MRAYRFKGEKTLTELVRKVYDIRRKGLTAPDVGSALAKANPSLKRASKKAAIASALDAAIKTLRQQQELLKRS